jgi:hypothetical protein
MDFRRQQPRERQAVSWKDIALIFEALPKVEGQSWSWASDIMDDIELELAVIKFIVAMERCRGEPFKHQEVEQIMDKINAIRDEFMELEAKR